MPNQGFLRGSLSQYFLPKLMPHHQQGTLDGACGFYCVSMILDYFRLCSPEDEVADRRTRFSRLLQRLCKGDPFLEKGLSVSQINKALTFFNIAKGRFPRFDEHKEYHDPKTLLRFMKRHIRRGRPAMLLYTSPGTTIGHFVVVVGASLTRNSIFVMDPSQAHREGLLYNERLDLYRHSGVLYVKDSGGEKFQINSCLAFWPQRKKRKSRRL